MDTELDRRRLGLARIEIAKRLSSAFKTWTVDGDTVMGPGTLAVKVEDQHKLGPTHFDIGFVLNREQSDVPVLWDCVAGLGKTEEDVVGWAVKSWADCTAPTILEMLTQDGHWSISTAHGQWRQTSIRIRGGRCRRSPRQWDNP